MTNPKWYPYLAIVVMLAPCWPCGMRAVTRGPRPGIPTTVTTNRDRRDPASVDDRNHGFDRRISYIDHTEHARCRMQMPPYFPIEVEEIMRKGDISYNKSDLNARPCPFMPWKVSPTTISGCGSSSVNVI